MKIKKIPILITFLGVGLLAFQPFTKAGNNLENSISRDISTYQIIRSLEYAVLNPSRSDCNKAIKILTQYERLAKKFGSNLSPKRIQELNRKRDDEIIKKSDLPGRLQREMPGIFQNFSLEQIRRLCSVPAKAQ